MRPTVLIAVLLLLPFKAGPAEPPISGLTGADAATANDLRRSVIDIVRVNGHCPIVEAIRIDEVSSDVVPPAGVKNYISELWVASGCGKEFPTVVFWAAGPNGLRFSAISSQYWKDAPPNYRLERP